MEHKSFSNDLVLTSVISVSCCAHKAGRGTNGQRGLTKLHIIFGSFCILYAMISVTGKFYTNHINGSTIHVFSVISVSYSAMEVWIGPTVEGDNFEVGVGSCVEVSFTFRCYIKLCVSALC